VAYLEGAPTVVEPVIMPEASSPPAVALLHFHLRFESLFVPGRALAFPCDESGCVQLDALSDPARDKYLYARAVVGREYAMPAVVSCA
jgi:hypothetical protein